MRKFLTNILKFVAFIGLGFGLITLINLYIISKSELPLESTSILIMGDSHPQRALNPTMLPNALNISQGAEPYVLSYWKLKKIVSERRVDTVILGFGHHNISAFNDIKFTNKTWSVEMFKRSYTIADYDSIPEMEIDYLEFFKTISKRLCLFPRKDHIFYIGNYKNSNKNDLSDLEKAIGRHFFNNITHEDYKVSAVALSYLNGIVNLCKKNEIELILVGAPVHSSYYEKIPDHIKSQFESEIERLKQQNITVLNLTNKKYPDSMFYNVDHLNSNGANAFTKEISKFIHY